VPADYDPGGWDTPAQRDDIPANVRAYPRSGNALSQVRYLADRIVGPSLTPPGPDWRVFVANKPAPPNAGEGSIRPERQKEIRAWVEYWKERIPETFTYLKDKAVLAGIAVDYLTLVLRGHEIPPGPPLVLKSGAERSFLAQEASRIWSDHFDLRPGKMALMLARKSADYNVYPKTGPYLAWEAVRLAWGNNAKHNLAALGSLVGGLEETQAYYFIKALASKPGAGPKLAVMLKAIRQEGRDPALGQLHPALGQFVKGVYMYAQGGAWKAVAPQMPDALAFAIAPDASDGKREQLALRIKMFFTDHNAKTLIPGARDMGSLNPGERQLLLRQLEENLPGKGAIAI
jgi:hypothetical protein